MHNPTENNRTEPRISQFDIEKFAKILSLVAIPVVLAIFGWVIQNQLSERSLSQEYVKLAVSILEKPKSSEVPAGLRDWAVDLLNQNSPTKFNSETIRQLKTGEINLAGVIGNLVTAANNGGGIAVSPNAKTVATGQDNGHVVIWELASGRLLSTLIGHNDSVTAVVYSPDARMLFSGSFDKTVVAWDVATGRMILRLKGSAAVVGLAVSPDGRSLVVRSTNSMLQTWDILSGKILTEVQLGTPRP
jgi:WD40 repeat protein